MTLTALGVLIQKYQDARNWTDGELAQRAGISRSGLGKIKNGETEDPRATNLARIGEALGIPHEELRAAAGNFPTPPDAPISPALVGQLSARLRGMTPAQQQQFIALLAQAANDPVVAGELLALWRQSQQKP